MTSTLMIRRNLNDTHTNALQKNRDIRTSSNQGVFLHSNQKKKTSSSFIDNQIFNNSKKRNAGNIIFNFPEKNRKNMVKTKFIKLESKKETLLEKSIQLLPFNEEFSPDEFKDYLEGYEKNWENAIKVSEFSFDDLDNGGSVKKELGNFFDD
ncbi:hypothetical protein [Mammaliicoccus sciuri]|uniref:hypothetical protein n=1 Tax=Mammaliicoccus sciuri TaxID=1296 RepID=UPI002B25B919|nr:hypothetical protein [Mammaliicoccus sciuri]WQK73579.1 hypothetical protein P3U33_12140 [Mammaliicoccus sciuri]